ncbi:Protein ILITYHIA [Durusdinium trenchii]|uniref:Protein ILITYHIA n=1 Tax=Durusdinium trenchii TaxID=1381693 RepID=A0ABP0RIQ4_9DINO
MLRILSLALLKGMLASEDLPPTQALQGDDECRGDDACAVNALQVKATDASGRDEPEDTVADLDHITPEDTELGAHYADGFLANMCHGVGYCAIGGYMIVAGHGDAHGMESIHGSNAGYYDSMLRAAYNRCASGSCVLITNPVGHRTQSRFHIHYRHFNGGGASLKKRLENQLCGTHGWENFSECGTGKAKFFSGYPAVFREVLGQYGGHLANVGVTVWPGSCGHGVIVLATTHCSIEHSISANHFTRILSPPPLASICAPRARSFLRGAGKRLSILTDPDCRRRYWKPSWSLCFAKQQPEEAEGTVEPWQSQDYVLVRFAIDQASLQSVVDTSLRWDARHIKRIPGREGAHWEEATELHGKKLGRSSIKHGIQHLFDLDHAMSRLSGMRQVCADRDHGDGTVDADAARAVLRLGALDASAEVAKKALEDLQLDVDEVLLMELVDYASKRGTLPEVQDLVAKALAEVLTELDDPKNAQTALELLTQLFREESTSRITVAKCLERIYATNLKDEEQVFMAFKFLLRPGLSLTNGSTPEASELRDVLLAAGVAAVSQQSVNGYGISLIEQHGETYADGLIAIVEQFEDSAASTAGGESAHLGIAVFLGGLSKHLAADHVKVPEILPRLLQRLQDKTSTTSVQNAIVKVMPPLMKQNKEKAAETLDQLLETALAPKTDAVTRRGAAMGVGATVKGLGIQAVRQHNILITIGAAAEERDRGSDKKSAAVREGALLCLEGLTMMLGRLFEPYVVSSLPLLLQNGSVRNSAAVREDPSVGDCERCSSFMTVVPNERRIGAFSDSQQSVRNASQVAAGAMMSQLSGPGVKQVLTPLLAGIQDKQWRTKLGSIELLASMTQCLEKQLAACLPQVVPALCTVINDQHAKVKEAAREAINKVGSIISSPEIKAIAPQLISAMTDGAQFEHITRNVLDKLLATSFVHHIDAPSLSLVCPLIHRAMKERSGDMKRKGAQIVGAMVLLIKDAKDIQPYLEMLIPQLKVTLVDQVPDVRATSAKAFGTLANALPEDMLGDVLPWLFEMLRSSGSAVERSGAAHGLSEVLMAKGSDRIEMLLPDILTNASNQEADPEAREGYMGLFCYLPVAMGSTFEPYIEEVLNMLLKGMGDDVSSVRDTAFKAAQTITKHFGSSHTALLLPPLEEGVFDIDWRIRHGAVQLMGQLIQQILRAHRIPTNSAELMQVEALPREWRCHMLASLYIVRSDENIVVKQACGQVWKAVVQNTPRTLRELLPTLMTRLIANLASTNREKQRVAARCVGDLVGKLGERVMPELMPIFMDTLSEGDAHVREGVCIGLAELINATTKDLLAAYLTQLIPAIQQAIIDDDDSVRNQASTVVALLHNAVGPRATKDVVEWLLEQLEGDEEWGELFLHGLEQLMKKQPGAVLPTVLGELASPTKTEWTPLQVQGLASLSVVPDRNAVHRAWADVYWADPEMQEVAVESAARVVDAVEQTGLVMLLNELVGPMQDAESARRRVVGAQLLKHFFENTGLDVVPALPLALPALLPSALADQDEDALSAAMGALNAIVKKCKKEELPPYLNEVRGTVLKLITDPETKKVDPEIFLPGLCNHKGLEPLYPIYQHALVHGSPDAREVAAKGLGELVDHTTEKALAPYAVKITGPLIRIVGDKFPGSVKKAIVEALRSLLARGGDTLKPFLPQLQTTYVKCLSDPPNSEDRPEVREKAAESLGMLVRRAPRTEPLINELCTGVSNQVDPAARLAMGHALGEVLLNLPQATSETAQGKILAALTAQNFDLDSPRECEVIGWALGMLLRRHLPTEKAVEVFNEQVATRDGRTGRRCWHLGVVQCVEG